MTREPLSERQSELIHSSLDNVAMAAVCLCNTNIADVTRDAGRLAAQITAGRHAIIGNRPQTALATWRDSFLVMLRSLETVVAYLQEVEQREVDGTS